MSPPPLMLAVGAADLLALLLLAVAVLTAARVAAGWAPEQASRAQLLLEARAETAALLARWALGLWLLGSLLLLVAITQVLPELIPGAMCGTGVLQAAGPPGARAIILRLLALALLAAWQLLDRLNQADPRAPLTLAAARALLLAAPLVLLGAVDTARAFMSPATGEPVSCCAMVYAQGSAGAGELAAAAGSAWLWPALIGATLLVAAGLALWRLPAPWPRRLSRPAAALGAAWVVMAYVALVQVLAPYHYGVLHHHCPWCLFLPEHHRVAFVAFGALAVAALEGLAAAVAATVGQSSSEAIAKATRRRVRTAGWRLAFAVVVFTAITALPALLYRLRHGTWIDGSL